MKSSLNKAFFDHSVRADLAKALAMPITRRLDMSSAVRQALRVEPLCRSCGKATEEGAFSGCPECVARSVMES